MDSLEQNVEVYRRELKKAQDMAKTYARFIKDNLDAIKERDARIAKASQGEE